MRAIIWSSWITAASSSSLFDLRSSFVGAKKYGATLWTGFRPKRWASASAVAPCTSVATATATVASAMLAGASLTSEAPPCSSKMTIVRCLSHLRGGGVKDGSTVECERLAEPAPGAPFHYAFPVHSLEAAKAFYGSILGCIEGRSSEKWQDYSLHGHQIVCHWVGDDYRCVDYYNPVDGDEVPVPHFGLSLTVEQFHELAQRLRESAIEFIIPPHLRFEGMPGEQYTMFLKDPSGNNLEFKAMTKPENLFAKYNVVDK